MANKPCRHGIALTKPCPDCELGVALAACARVLIKLAVVSEVPATRPNTGASEARPMPQRTRADQAHPRPLTHNKPYGDTRIPAGVNEDATIDGREHAPSKQLSLHAHYQWRMMKAQRERNVTDLLVLAAQAQREYAELMDPRSVCRDTTEAGTAKRLLTDLRGCSAEEAAAWMSAPGQSQKSALRWVRYERIQAGRDPDTGERREHDSTLKRAVQMVKDGASRAAVADALGISKTRVIQLLEGA